MSVCGAFHPNDMEITCRLEPSNHREHLGGFPPVIVTWPNETYIPPSTGDFEEVVKVLIRGIPSEKVVPEGSLYWQEKPRKGIVKG